MNILLISECDKRALIETRRILDQFAERRGERTWQTPITRDGLNTLRLLLRKTARKNTAVACHWIHGINHSELLWVVGDKHRFNSQGAVPTNIARRNILKMQDENDWHTGEAIHLFTALAALLHDFGKASEAFQNRLHNQGKIERNDYRHEWVSLRMFQAFVGQDTDTQWLARLAEPTAADNSRWAKNLVRDGLDGSVTSPFAGLAHAPLAQAIGWLVVTHHRLPQVPPPHDKTINAGHFHNLLGHITSDWNQISCSKDTASITPYWTFTATELPVHCPVWKKQAAKLARRLQILLQLQQPGQGDWINNPYVMHISRLCLMLADHHYSALAFDAPTRIKVAAWGKLCANTHRSPGQKPKLFQPLNEHLIGVAQHSQLVTHALAGLETHLPRMKNHRLLRQRSTQSAFRWQDKAADMAAAQRDNTMMHGAFIINMASTGCGKTLANAKIMNALADPAQGMRCAFAMGLRTLTLQTGRAFRHLLQLDEEHLAILVGGAASRALFEHHEAEAESTGSASSQQLLDSFCDVDALESNEHDHPLLSKITHDTKIRKLLAAPLLVCTIDHLVPATESQRGGHQIAPMLRLMGSDLVLDEPDDFSLDDLPALGRLVHWAGLLGSRVLLSSATLAPALVQGLFEAYLAGRSEYAKNRGHRPSDPAPPSVCCLWIDEYHQQSGACANPSAFEATHQLFAQQRSQRLSDSGTTEVRRRATLIPLKALQGQQGQDAHAILYSDFAQTALQTAVQLHGHHHSIDPHSGKRISFGLIRMANIDPLVEVGLSLFRSGVAAGIQGTQGVHIHLCIYHARFPLLLRSVIERQLDSALNRHAPDAVFGLPDIRQRIDRHTAQNQLFIVLGSPVTEVGRDHDYDWAVVEPSSMRSLIQLAGRVKRHRSGICNEPNVALFDTNLRHLKNPNNPNGPAFTKPGFENKAGFLLTSHYLTDVLRPHERDVIDARPRIVSLPPEQLQPKTSLVDLEHARLRYTMLAVQAKNPAPTAPISGIRRCGPPTAAAAPRINAAHWWQVAPRDALLTYVLPQKNPFRKQTQPQKELLLLLNEDEDEIELHEALDWVKNGPSSVNITRERMVLLDDSLVQGQGITAWGNTSYLEAVHDWAQRMHISPYECARRFGAVSVSVSDEDSDWRVRFHPVLGFTNLPIRQ